MLDFIFSLSDRVLYVAGAVSAIISIVGFILTLIEKDKKKTAVSISTIISVVIFIVVAIFYWIRYDYTVVPNLEGLNKNSAMSLLKNNELELGNVEKQYEDLFIVSQNPKAGSYTKKGNEIDVFFLKDISTVKTSTSVANLRIPLREIQAYIYEGSCRTVVASSRINEEPTEIYLIDLQNQVKYTEFFVDDDETYTECYVFEDIPEGNYLVHIEIPEYSVLDTEISLKASQRYDGHWGGRGIYLEKEDLEEYCPFSIYIGTERNNRWYPYDEYNSMISYDGKIHHSLGFSDSSLNGLSGGTIFAHIGTEFDVSIYTNDYQTQWETSFVFKERGQEEIKLAIYKDGTIKRSYAYS